MLIQAPTYEIELLIRACRQESGNHRPISDVHTFVINKQSLTNVTVVSCGHLPLTPRFAPLSRKRSPSTPAVGEAYKNVSKIL